MTLAVPCAALLPVCVLPLCITGGRHDNITLTTIPPPKCSTRLHLICMLSQQRAAFDFDNKGLGVTLPSLFTLTPSFSILSPSVTRYLFLIPVIHSF